MTRVRFIAPASGGLLVTGARVALANALSGTVLRDAFAALTVLIAARLLHRSREV